MLKRWVAVENQGGGEGDDEGDGAGELISVSGFISRFIFVFVFSNKEGLVLGKFSEIGGKARFVKGVNLFMYLRVGVLFVIICVSLFWEVKVDVTSHIVSYYSTPNMMLVVA